MAAWRLTKTNSSIPAGCTMSLSRQPSCQTAQWQRQRPTAAASGAWCLMRSSRALLSVMLLVAAIPLLFLGQLFGGQGVLPAPLLAARLPGSDSLGMRPEQRQLLQQVDASRRLRVAAASGLSGAAAAADGSIRAATGGKHAPTAALWQLKQAAAAAGTWSGSHQRLLERPLAALQLLNQESQASRGIFEYTHVSKTGGTTMCALAGQASCLNPQLNEELNCMIRAFEDEPAWTLEVFAQVQEKQVGRPGR
jgi:hypothetical protein